MSNCQEWTATRPIPEGMTIFCLVSFTTGAVRSAMPATAGFLVYFTLTFTFELIMSQLSIVYLYTCAASCVINDDDDDDISRVRGRNNSEA